MISEISNAGGFASPAEFRKERFKKLDQNGDGGIDKSELQAISEKRRPNKKGPNVDEIFDKVDINHDGVIDESENDKAMAEFEQRAKDQSEVRTHQSISLLGVKNQEQDDLRSESSRLELLLAQLKQSTDNYTGDEASGRTRSPLRLSSVW